MDVLKVGGAAPLVFDPAGVSLDEPFELVVQGFASQTSQLENLAGAAGIDRHHRRFGRRHELGPDVRGAMPLCVPVHRGAMAHGIDEPVLVLEFEFLFLFRQQTRIDSGIFDEFAGFHDALDTRLKQRLLDPFLRSSRAGTQPLPIVESDGEDDAIPIWPRANVDAGAVFPDRSVRRTGFRPLQEVFPEFGSFVFLRPKPALLVAVSGVLVDSGGRGNGEADGASNKKGKPDGRRRHVASSTHGLHKGPAFRFITGPRGRVFFLIFESGRIGVTAGRGGVDAGWNIELNRTQHTRRVSIQR